MQRADAVTRRDAAAPNRSEGAYGTLTGQRAAIFDIDVGGHRTVDRQHALFHPGITAIGVITQQRQRTGARFGQAAVPADVVTPRIEVAFARRAASLNRGTGFDDISQAGDIHHELFFTVGARYIIFLRDILLGNKHFRAVDRIA